MKGKILSCTTNKNKITIEFEEGIYYAEIIRDDIIRLMLPKYEKMIPSKAIEGNKAVECEFTAEFDECVTIKTKLLTVKIYNDGATDIYDAEGNILSEDYRGTRISPQILTAEQIEILLAEGHSINQWSTKHDSEVVKKMQGDEYFYGLGEKTGYLNKRNYEYDMWNSDLPTPHVETSQYSALYKSVPFMITKRNCATFGMFFDNTNKSHFDMGFESDEYYRYGCEGGNLDYYFIYGPTMKQVVEGYTYLTGRAPLPQMWTLGYGQSRWGYKTREELEGIAKKFRELDVPCDSVYMDIDYMDNYKVFTFDDKKFPNHKEMFKNFEKDGFKVVTIIDPGVKEEKGYAVYDEGVEKGYFVLDEDGSVYVNTVWPGESVFPDFTSEKVRSWWSGLQKRMVDAGVRGIWCDMNEPASFNGPLPLDLKHDDDGIGATHKNVHNVYGHYMAKATYEGLKEHDGRRPMVITRACYAGSQKYSTVWTGDNTSLWSHLQMAVPMLCNLGLSGVAFCGTDIGGFGGDTTPELLSRWVQVGCFSPLFRNHACNSSRPQEPWVFGKPTLDINRKYIKLRYKLMPYFYNLMQEHTKNGLPVIRPLVLEYENDANTYEINDQFMVGSDILVAPVLAQGKKAREVYLPEGEWYDYWTKKKITGGKYIIKEAPIDVCPIYIKAGSIIPNYPDINYIGEKEIETLILDVYPDSEGKAQCTHYNDNGENFDYEKGKYNEYRYTAKDRKLTVEKLHEGYKDYTDYELILN